MTGRFKGERAEQTAAEPLFAPPPLSTGKDCHSERSEESLNLILTTSMNNAG